MNATWTNRGCGWAFAMRSFALLAASLLWTGACVSFAQPLASWNDGPATQAIFKFVTDIATQGAPTFVAPSDRIAVFDNDGTLWSEQPLYFQGIFVLERIKAMAPQHPEWKDRQPFRSILAGDMKSAFAGERLDCRRHEARLGKGFRVPVVGAPYVKGDCHGEIDQAQHPRHLG